MYGRPGGEEALFARNATNFATRLWCALVIENGVDDKTDFGSGVRLALGAVESWQALAGGSIAE